MKQASTSITPSRTPSTKMDHEPTQTTSNRYESQAKRHHGSVCHALPLILISNWEVVKLFLSICKYVVCDWQTTYSLRRIAKRVAKRSS